MRGRVDSNPMGLIHLYRAPVLHPSEANEVIRNANAITGGKIEGLETEFCFNIETTAHLSQRDMEVLRWLLSETFEPDNFSENSLLKDEDGFTVEVGPRMNFSTAWSTNAVSICRSCGISRVSRIERSRRYLFIPSGEINQEEVKKITASIHDRMTECQYEKKLESFDMGILPEPVYRVPLLEEGRSALEGINREMGLAFDDWDLDYYTKLFVDELGRNPTNVECFDVAQSNSEHSRHWFFKGRLVVDGIEREDSLLDLVKDTLSANPSNSMLAFRDNSSAIRGFKIDTIIPEKPGCPSRFIPASPDYHIIFTAETHNFPSGVAPFPGAETGTGGRIRDVHATGRSALVVAGTAAYCVGNLKIPGYPLPWENTSYPYPDNLASPLEIEIEASNGASDYGNKFGEPIIQGYTRSFGLSLPGGERREWLKPIMFTGGVGQLDGRHLEKMEPEPGMLVIKIGGPAYRIGMGGGAASSMVQGENVAELDFNAVQRGDAEMEQKVNRVIRSCSEIGDRNPIISIHDQGAGGNCNVVKEIVHPAGGRIEIRRIQVGDDTLSVLEIWGAEYQEQDALLIRPAHLSLFSHLCEREKVPMSVIGHVTGDGMITVTDEQEGTTPVHLDLEKVLGSMPRKVFHLSRLPKKLDSLDLPDNLTVMDALERVLRLVSVGSKRFLTSKVDRSVTGLIAQQQCSGPLQLTVSDVAVISQSHFGLTGAAISIGEQPIKGLVNPSAMARMALGEALTNLVWAHTTGLSDVKCSANWMWAAKMEGEGADLLDAARALHDMMIELGVAVDGGKDSLSMAAQVPVPGGQETVKAPGSLTISAYVSCNDITKTVTPDLKHPGESILLLVDLGNGYNRLGGSALAQVYGQIGKSVPDVENPDDLRRAFSAIQTLIGRGLVSAGHDRSDGGLVTTLLEMSFAGNCGMVVTLPESKTGEFPPLFSEELGLVLEVRKENEGRVLELLSESRVPFSRIGHTVGDASFEIRLGDRTVIREDIRQLRDLWEETSFRLDMLQSDPLCIEQEREDLHDRTGPQFSVSFRPRPTPPDIISAPDKPVVAVIREEGSNGDREMISAFYLAGFDVWDVTMTDLMEGRFDLGDANGVVFVGGFSYADVLDSAKGWAGSIRFNDELWNKFQRFRRRPDTFSLGVCNGCQLMALLGWVPWEGIPDEKQPRFIRNSSGRFESRFVAVSIAESPSLMLRGMEGSTLGIWVAHGEGRAHFPESELIEELDSKNLLPVRFVDDRNRVTERYPLNPNGSPMGIAAMCSLDGRHLAMMPHPERVFLKWQWPWMPEEMRKSLEASPWIKMFQNARKWVEESRKV